MSSDQPQIIILFGRSGCGKGTQAKLLQQEFGFDYLSSGDLLRERMKQDDFSGRKLRKVLDRGERAPTFLMFQVWSEKIREIKNKPDLKGLIIDGSPRSLLEAELMDHTFDWYEWSNVKIILLDISEEEAFNRLTKRRICQKCGRLIPWLEPFKALEKCDQCGGKLEKRFDDRPEAIKERLNYFKRDVQPVVDYYEKQGRLIRINGEQSIEDVYQDILKAIGQ
jgi:adenylate kinase